MKSFDTSGVIYPSDRVGKRVCRVPGGHAWAIYCSRDVDWSGADVSLYYVLADGSRVPQSSYAIPAGTGAAVVASTANNPFLSEWIEIEYDTAPAAAPASELHVSLHVEGGNHERH